MSDAEVIAAGCGGEHLQLFAKEIIRLREALTVAEGKAKFAADHRRGLGEAREALVEISAHLRETL